MILEQGQFFHRPVAGSARFAGVYRLAFNTVQTEDLLQHIIDATRGMSDEEADAFVDDMFNQADRELNQAVGATDSVDFRHRGKRYLVADDSRGNHYTRFMTLHEKALAEYRDKLAGETNANRRQKLRNAFHEAKRSINEAFAKCVVGTIQVDGHNVTLRLDRKV